MLWSSQIPFHLHSKYIDLAPVLPCIINKLKKKSPMQLKKKKAKINKYKS